MKLGHGLGCEGGLDGFNRRPPKKQRRLAALRCVRFLLFRKDCGRRRQPPDSASNERMILAAALLLAASLLSAEPVPQNVSSASAGQQENRPVPQAGVLKVEAPSVVVDVIVTDRKGRSASDLAAEDFALYDNNVQQRIVTFVPPLPAGSQPVPAIPGVQPRTPQPGSTSAAAGEVVDLAKVHFITLVLDLGDLQLQNIKKACDAAAEYIRTALAPEDFVAVYYVSQTLHLAQSFTRDRQRAVQAVAEISNKPPGGRLTAALRLSTQDDISRLESEVNGFGSSVGPGAGVPSSLSPQDAMMVERELGTLRRFLWTQGVLQARAVLVAMRAIAQAYQDLPGRKNVIVFSQGFTHAPEAQPALQAVVDAANHSNVAFYVVDAGGMTANYGATNSLPEDLAGTRHAYDTAQEGAGFREGYTKFDRMKHTGLEIEYQDLENVAQATGGFYVKNQNDLSHGLALADRDLREFYTLVYQPTDRHYDGSFHKIKVELLRRGYEVRYRTGYWAIPPGQEMMMTPAAAQLLGALASGSLRPAFAPHLNAALLLAPDGKLAAPVSVSVPGKSVHFEGNTKSYRTGVTLVLVAYSSDGRLVSAHQRFLTLDLDKKQWRDFEGKDLEINGRLALPELEPLRVKAILQFSNGAVALGEQAIDIPAGAPGPRLTSLLLSDRIEPAQGDADPSDPLRGENFQLYLPAQPHFSAADKLTLYFGIVGAPFDADVQRPHLRVSYVVKCGATLVMSLAPEEMRPSRAGAPNRMLVLKQFDLKGFRPGSYTLEVTVEDLASHRTISQRAGFLVG
jgi:VWFA-related protein